MSYWVFVLANRELPSTDILKQRLRQDHFYGFKLKKKKPDLWGQVSPGDKVIFYLGGPKMAPHYVFGGLATVKEKFDSLTSQKKGEISKVGQQIADDLGIDTTDEEIWETPVPVKPLSSDLDFIRNKGHWETAFQRVLIKIQQKDFQLITAMAKPDELSRLFSDKGLIVDGTTREAIIKQRIKQYKFREEVLEFWQQKCSVTDCCAMDCSVTNCSALGLLQASHIKPWSDSNADERMDKYNGLLLTPNLHAAFDAGLISFEDDGGIAISKSLHDQDCKLLGIDKRMRIPSLTAQHKKYLRFHRAEKFRI